MATVEQPTGTDVETLRNYVGGRWVESSAEERIDDIDPATGELLARVPLSTVCLLYTSDAADE